MLRLILDKIHDKFGAEGLRGIKESDSVNFMQDT